MRPSIVWLGALCVVSCSNFGNPGGIQVPSGTCTLSASAQGAADPNSLVADYARSAWVFYKAAASAPQLGSFAVPALALSTGMAEIYLGASGDTAAQIATTLGWQTDPNSIAAAHAALAAELAGAAAQGNMLVTCGTRIWVDSNVTTQPAWASPQQAAFGTTVGSVELVKDSSNSVLAIDAWVAQETRQRLQSVLQSGEVASGSTAVMTAAQDVVDAWAVPYQSNEIGTTFFPLDGNPAATNMLFQSQSTTMLATNTNDIQAVDIPLYGNTYAVLMLMPKSGFSAYEQAMDANTLAAVFAQLQPAAKSLVAVPPFQVQYRGDLTSALRSAGLTALLSATSDMSQAFIPANVTFANLAAETQLIFAPGGVGTVGDPAFTPNSSGTIVTPTLTFDHPFIFVLHDLSSNTALIVGRYVG